MDTRVPDNLLAQDVPRKNYHIMADVVQVFLTSSNSSLAPDANKNNS
jgi:hypothetical protein